MTHLIITRIHFTDDILFNHYFEVMKKTYIPSVNSQTNKNFKVVFIINPKHIPLIEPFFNGNAIYFENFDQIKNYCLENNVEIQTRHDCDDWMKDNYIETIQNLYKQKILEHDKFIIHSRVQKLDYETNEVFEHATRYENNNFISMFLTLCQKKYESFVYDKNHRFMWEVTKNIYLLDGGYTRLVVHGKNKLSTISEQDKNVTGKKKPELSLITPTFDNVEYLNSFLDSVEKSKKNYFIEVLIGIDGCEKTKNFIQKNFFKIPKYVKFFHFSENVGPYVIRNSMAKISNSNKLLFIDSDDLIHEDMISETIKNLDQYDVLRYKFYNFRNESDLKVIKKENINNFYSIGQLSINKHIFEAYNGFEPWICSADSEFKSREEGNRLKTKNIERILYFRRRHTKNITFKLETNHGSNIRQTYNSEIHRRKQKGLFIKNSPIVVTNFEEIVSREETIKFKSENNYTGKIVFTPNSHLQKNDRLITINSEELNSVNNENEKKEKLKVESNLELKINKINYDKINSVFQVNNPKFITTNQPKKNPLKLNSSTVQNLMKKNKKKLR